MDHYIDLDRMPREFEERDTVFLSIPKDLKTLKTWKSYKLSPRYYGPWKIVKKINSFAYELDLFVGCKFHHVFHVSCLRKILHDGDNLLVDGLIWF
ncbi:hypothetical protein O6H91_13G104700 [Diphasiastrum complanatum]|uniref:Uncharacterized protein n=1 Tax=Diphasiastrum complanatum TaxID=34168 RepID=A0ACC2BYJ3_DIPCM|nr:hypothetical protein O6H91_13G104700 [Diphasiastrum complanatum]